jgi:hypothetical protein
MRRLWRLLQNDKIGLSSDNSAAQVEISDAPVLKAGNGDAGCYWIKSVA